ncbi:MAG: molybdenum cofactor biosynthesis protein MoaE [Deltaproteobacteria bacterium]|nr:molybdenum cofactor biosynthesis protein MoaE [Deltaproteobacteria bacterium]MCB9785893.1 molybdenum cofactor biosynthesis protein MoaE [Deltaproteobacteria bacterium]
MDLNVLYFAHVRERVGLSSERLVCADGLRVADVVALLVDRHPSIRSLVPSLRVAVNGVFVEADASVPDGAELVLIPPVAGGAGPERVALTSAPLTQATLEALSALVAGPDRGAVVTFSGVVRNHARGRQVTRLYYEAYERMAITQLEAVVAEVEAALPGARVAVHHRTGMLEVGDIAVLIAVASAHRAEAFDACRRTIDRLKEEVPIWKREIGPDGEEWVSDRP